MILQIIIRKLKDKYLYGNVHNKNVNYYINLIKNRCNMNFR